MKAGHVVRFTPCGHERCVDDKSIKLAGMINAYLWCVTCDDMRLFEVQGSCDYDAALRGEIP